MSLSHNSTIAVLVSGSGSAAEAFIYEAQDGRAAAEAGLVVCNNYLKRPVSLQGVYLGNS